MMNIADRIQSLRKQKGMSQIELADAIGVSRQAVSKWESEQAIPDLDKIVAMSEIFGTTTDYLLKGIEPVETEDGPAAAVPVPEGKPALPKLSKEESIAFVEKLTHEYRSLEKLKEQISDNEKVLSRPVDSSYAEHAAFKFFWPFLIYSFLSFWLMIILTAIFSRQGEGGAIWVILCYAVPIGMLISGGIWARNKRDIKNAEASELARSKRDSVDKLRKETAELKSKLAVLEARVAKMDQAVPAGYKSSTKMEKLKFALSSGKAETLEEAVAFCDETFHS